MIELDHLSKRYGADLVVDEVSLRIRDGELLVLLGGSGSGKTTTLKMINRLVEPTSGRVLLDGEDVGHGPAHLLRRRIGYVFQKVGLFPHLTVAENVAITPTLLGWDAARIDRRVDELLELVELDPAQMRKRRPDALSGGQQQRVGVARALAAAPRHMLFDEPFGALDALTRKRLQDAVIRLKRELDLTAVFVTHDVAEAVLLGDRIAVLHEGRLAQVDTPRALLREPVNDFVRGLFEIARSAAQIFDQLEAGSG